MKKIITNIYKMTKLQKKIIKLTKKKIWKQS